MTTARSTDSNNLTGTATIDLTVNQFVNHTPLVTILSPANGTSYGTTYNFEVADINSYYVSAAKVLVHNCGGNFCRPDWSPEETYPGWRLKRWWASRRYG